MTKLSTKISIKHTVKLLQNVQLQYTYWQYCPVRLSLGHHRHHDQMDCSFLSLHLTFVHSYYSINTQM